VVQEDKQHADRLVALRGVEVMRIGEQPEAANEVGRGAGVGDVDRVAQRNPVAGCDGDVEQRAGWPRQIEVDERCGTAITNDDVFQTQVGVANILRFGAYATDELQIPPDVFDPALDEVDFGVEQPAAA
jgi:hypothetical protein